MRLGYWTYPRLNPGENAIPESPPVDLDRFFSTGIACSAEFNWKTMTAKEYAVWASRYSLQAQYWELVRNGYDPLEALSALDIV